MKWLALWDTMTKSPTYPKYFRKPLIVSHMYQVSYFEKDDMMEGVIRPVSITGIRLVTCYMVVLVKDAISSLLVAYNCFIGMFNCDQDIGPSVPTMSDGTLLGLSLA